MASKVYWSDMRTPEGGASLLEKLQKLMKAAELLARQEQSSESLRRKLIVRKYDAQEVDEAIEKLQKYNYLDDAEACRRQFENLYAECKLSIQQIIAKLIQRGFKINFIEQLIPDDAEDYELLVAEKLLAKKFTPAEKFDRAKAWQILSARGFDAEIISIAVEKFSV